MQKTDLTKHQLEQILCAITPILMERGIAHTSMDYIAQKLKMSKRTLYELFGSKDEMILEVFDYMQNFHTSNTDRIFRESSNTMEAMVKAIAYQSKFFSQATPVFFKDMDEKYKHFRSDYNNRAVDMENGLNRAFALGVKQGVFRSDVDYSVQMALFRIQMESLKRMEDNFPPGITLPQAIKVIAENLLRSIATPEGIKILEKYT